MSCYISRSLLLGPPVDVNSHVFHLFFTDMIGVERVFNLSVRCLKSDYVSASQELWISKVSVIINKIMIGIERFK